jgi:hypothetical protein
MKAFFDGVDPRAASTIAAVSRRMFDMRGWRKRLLADAGCGDADGVLRAVREGSLPEHPGYEAWLASQLAAERERTLHATLQWRCQISNGAWRPPPPRGGLAALAQAIRPSLPALFKGGMRLHRDGLSFAGTSGIEAVVRIVTPQAWSMEWQWAGAAWRLDTAPVTHAGLDGTAHVHLPDDSVAPCPVALPLTDDKPSIVLALLEALARSPTLGLA